MKKFLMAAVFFGSAALQISSPLFFSVRGIIPNIYLVATLCFFYYKRARFLNYQASFFSGIFIGTISGIFSEYNFFAVLTLWIIVILCSAFLMKNWIAENDISFLFLVFLMSFIFPAVFFGFFAFLNLLFKSQFFVWRADNILFFSFFQAIYNVVISLIVIFCAKARLIFSRYF